MKKNTKSVKKSEIRIAPTMTAAAAIVGLKIEVLQEAKNLGCAAFRSNGNVHIAALLKYLGTHPELVKDGKSQSLPADLREEKLLKMRAERKSAELEYAKSIGEVVSMSKVSPLIMALAKMVRAKLRQIPDRCSQKYSLMTDPLEIKHDLITEIDNALRSMAEFDIEQFKKEALEEAKKG
jgi:phage terminase Nu1 subunit (DNA packaging protein)